MEGGQVEAPITAQIHRSGERWQRLPLKHPIGPFVTPISPTPPSLLQ